jgi:uncharacterized protein
MSFLLFFSAFFLLYLGIHYYVFYRLAGMLSLQRKLAFYLLIIVFALTFPLASVLEHYVTNWITSIFYYIAASWFGAVMMAFCCLIIYELVRFFWKPDPKLAVFVLIGVVLMIVIYGLINAQLLHVKEIELPIQKLTAERTVVQLSDIHLGTIHGSGYLERIAKKVNSIDPDMVLITGDLLDGSGTLSNLDISPLNDIKAKTFFVTGNHERYIGIEMAKRLLNTTTVTVLSDQATSYRGIQLIGLDDPTWEFTPPLKEQAIKAMIEKIPRNKTQPTILLFHRPIGLEDAQSLGISLMLSGHTHDGQMIPVDFITKLFFPRNHGLYTYEGTFLYVSPGTGTWGPPMRTASMNEITVFHLVPAKNKIV